MVTRSYRADANKSTPAAAGGSWIRPEKRIALYARDGFCCQFCGNGIVDGARLSVDHVNASERGGKNDDGNLLTVCLSCNSAKQDLSMRGWLAYCRKRGMNVEGIAARVAKTTAKPIDRALGKALLAEHGGVNAVFEAVRTNGVTRTLKTARVAMAEAA